MRALVFLGESGLPAFHHTALEDFRRCVVHVVSLVRLNELFHVFCVDVVFTRDNQVDLRRLFVFNKHTVFLWCQID